MAMGWLIDDDQGQRRGVFDAGDGLTNCDAGNTGDGHDIAYLGLFGVGTFNPLKVNSLVILVLSSDPSRLEMLTSSPLRRVPLNTRAMARRPR